MQDTGRLVRSLGMCADSSSPLALAAANTQQACLHGVILASIGWVHGHDPVLQVVGAGGGRGPICTRTCTRTHI